jgi:hypothetical protein
VRVLFVVGALFIVLGIVRVTILGGIFLGAVGIALGVAMIARGLQARRTAI